MSEPLEMGWANLDYIAPASPAMDDNSFRAWFHRLGEPNWQEQRIGVGVSRCPADADNAFMRLDMRVEPRNVRLARRYIDES